MQFGYFGINYKNASLAVRDHISFTENKKIDFMQKAESFGVNQCLVLATCNRSEVFYFFEDNAQCEQMKEEYHKTFPDVDLSPILMEKYDREAITYLFCISAGLESAVLGEDQILGQLKDALMLSKALGYCKKQMHRVVENAMSCAKSLKTKYKISEIPLSVSYIGIREVQRSCGFNGKRVLIVGSGATAMLALKYVKEYETRAVYLCSRNPAHAKIAVSEYSNVKVILYDDRYEKIKDVDIVISATSSPHYAIEADKCRFSMPITFLDLAAPRDVEPRVGENRLVTIINLDTLEQISKDNQRERERLTRLCSKDVNNAVLETVNWLFESRVDFTIESLHKRCDEILEESYSYLNRKLNLSEREQRILKKIMKASLKKLIKEPIVELKKLDTPESQEEYTKMLETLFRFE